MSDIRLEPWLVRTRCVLHDVEMERVRQVRQYGVQQGDADLPDGTGPRVAWLMPFSLNPAIAVQRGFRSFYEDYEDAHGHVTWSLLVREELAEAFEQEDPELLRAELLQVAALCVSWIEALDTRDVQHQPDSQQPLPIFSNKKEI